MHIDVIDENNFLTKEQINLIKNILLYATKVESIDHNVELSVVIVSDDEIKRLNNEFRNKNEPTDVLSFSMYDDINFLKKDGQIPITLGDIVISIERVKEQAKAYFHSFERELAFLTLHGFLHLIGYTHDTKTEEERMFNKQEQILKEFQLERN